MTITISNQQARRLILHLQGLTRAPHVAQSLNDLENLILQMGFVQLDSIRWVERAQHMILFARNQTYRPSQLRKLIEQERALFEHWTHDASVIPCSFYPYWKHKFARNEERLSKQFHNWQGPGYRIRCDELLTTITENGPLRSRDVERREKGPQEMWQWHDGKAALEFLWRTGQLCIARRDGFQKVYDLAHHGVPDHHHEAEVSHDQFVDWACRSALDRLGFGTASDIARFWDLISIDEVRQWLDDQSENSVRSVEVEGNRRQQTKVLSARADIASLLLDLPEPPARVRALSPFDPVIRDRNRLSWLFGFDYRIEIYVPEAKRQWGYYVFPLLERERLIGRIDMRVRRKTSALEVKRLWWEPGIKPGSGRMERLASELLRQARLAGAQQVVWLDGATD